MEQSSTKMEEKRSIKVGIVPWLICGVGALFYSYEYILRITPSVMIGQLMGHFNIHASAYGAVTAFYAYAYVPMQLPVGVLMDRYGPRRLLTFACMCCFIGTFLFAGTSSLTVASTGRFLVGFGSAFAFVGVLKLATIWLPPNKLAFVAGLAAGLGSLGAIFGDNVLNRLVIDYGWRETIYITGVLGIIITSIIWFSVRDENTSIKIHKKQKPSRDFRRGFIELMYICKNKQIWVNGLYGCFIYLPTTVLAEQWGINYLEHAHNFSSSDAAFGNSLIFAGFTVGAPLMGWVSDTVGSRRWPMMAGSIGAAIISSIIIFMPSISHQTLFIALFAMGLFYGSQALVFAVGRELSSKHVAGTAIAVTNMCVMLGSMFLSPLVGVLLDWHAAHAPIHHPHVYLASDYQFALAIIPIGIVISGIATLFLKETFGQANKQGLI